MTAAVSTRDKRPRHWMKYVKWEWVKRWKARVRQERRHEETAYPYSFGSKDRAFLGFTGDVLWLVSLPDYDGYRQAPSLIARLDITAAGEYGSSAEFLDVAPEVRGSGHNIVLGRHDGESYFPINNMFHTLLELEFEGRAPRLADAYERRDTSRDATRGPYFSLAQHFRKHRLLTPDSVDKIEDFAAAVREGRRAFISYRRSDFPQRRGGALVFPEQLGIELTAQRIACWWDQWNLPGGHDESSWLRPNLLEDLLEDAVRQAAWMVALMGPGYLASDDDSWTRWEWQGAGALRTASGRRHEMRRLAVFFSKADRQAHRARWIKRGDRTLVAAEDEPGMVAAAIARVISSS